jgi:hypothetical protein
MNIPIKEEKITLSPEQQERMYWAKIKYDSHKWIEYYKGYYKCEFCDSTHTSVLTFDTVNICKKNPNLFPMDNQTPNPMKNETIKTEWSLRSCFEQMRDANGDVMLTEKQQEEIVRLVEKRSRK